MGFPRKALSMLGTGMALGPAKGAAPAEKQAPTVTDKGEPGAHLQAAMSAHRKGDHQLAKRHALKAVNILHQMGTTAPSAGAGPGLPGAPPGSTP